MSLDGTRQAPSDALGWESQSNRRSGAGHVVVTLPDGRYSLASTSDADVAGALLRAVLGVEGEPC